MKEKRGILRKGAPIFAMALFVLMLGCVLLLCAFGSSIYGYIVEQRNTISAKRAGLSYVTQRVRAGEEKGAIKIVDGPQGNALVLVEASEQAGYETRIYLHEGQLVEEYTMSDTAFNPQNAQPIISTSRFDIIIENGQLLITTSEGAAYISLHVQEAFAQ